VGKFHIKTQDFEQPRKETNIWTGVETLTNKKAMPAHGKLTDAAVNVMVAGVILL